MFTGLYLPPGIVALNLIMFYHNHRRYKSGTRQGKAPIERLTGKPLEAPWWELFRQQINTKRGVTAPGTGLSRPPLQLVVDNDGCTDRQAIASGQTIVGPIDATETIANPRILKRPHHSICAQSLIASLARRAGFREDIQP